jgi:hypothetical protein
MSYRDPATVIGNASTTSGAPGTAAIKELVPPPGAGLALRIAWVEIALDTGTPLAAAFLVQFQLLDNAVNQLGVKTLSREHPSVAIVFPFPGLRLGVANSGLNVRHVASIASVAWKTSVGCYVDVFP